ncbi:hypothetical protein SAMN04489724_0697 [Algoriphagus locisalis]|uniref:Uncharacterized protein n=1 Tax=Algoriphagus locisalis TaxID=305507 RepID=A0A1I6XVX3_9BACT|nr:hypothetical protein [Algoriphagus locisalis]SFT42450.1 hypothetical protein SAMN04489724_0697 [Algoriphagus locisalis]
MPDLEYRLETIDSAGGWKREIFNSEFAVGGWWLVVRVTRIKNPTVCYSTLQMSYSGLPKPFLEGQYDRNIHLIQVGRIEPDCTAFFPFLFEGKKKQKPLSK